MGLSVDFGTPVNTALLVYILYSVQRIIFPPIPDLSPKTVPSEFKKGYSWMPRSHPPAILYQTYTPKTLAKYDGKDGGRILLAINGLVFDVTAGRNFYGPGKKIKFVCPTFRAQPTSRRDVWKLCRKRCVQRDGEAVVRFGYGILGTVYCAAHLLTPRQKC